MPIRPENLPRHEFIGLEVEVVESTDPNQEGIKGEVLDETRDMIRIEDAWIEKEGTIFRFTLPSGEEEELKGDIIKKRPEDRVKMTLPEDYR